MFINTMHYVSAYNNSKIGENNMGNIINRDELVYDKIKKVITILDEIDDMIETQKKELQQTDLMLSDWYHYIENNKLTDTESVKIMKEIQTLRKIRRCLHREYEIEATYKNNAGKVMGNNTRSFLLAEINKTLKRLDADYKNRVLTDEYIKEVLASKRGRGRPRKDEVVEKEE